MSRSKLIPRVASMPPAPVSRGNARIAPLFTACAAGLVASAPALAQNAAAGQVLWDIGRSAPTPAVVACATCHGGNGGAANNVTLATIRQRLTNNGGLTVANAQASINRTLTTPGGVASMIALYPAGSFSAADIANLAAFIAQAPSAPPPPPPPAGAIEATPATLTFTAAMGATSASQTVTVRNGRTTAVTFDASPVVALSTSAAPADFLLSAAGAAGSPTTCTAGGTLAAGAQCTIGISFRPSMTGARSATWELRFVTAGVAPVSLTLNGTGSPAAAPAPAPSPAPAPAPTPAPAPSPSPVPGGSAPAGVTNAGAGATGWLALGLLGAAALRRRRR